MKIRFDIWYEIISTVRRNKLRTFLTGFSVAWGIFMLIVLLGSGNGLMNGFQSNFADRATNSIKVYGSRTSKTFEGMQKGRVIQLDNTDMLNTETKFPAHVGVAGAILKMNNRTISKGDEYVVCSLVGVEPSYVEIEPYRVAENNGRVINKLDLDERRKVIVIHPRTAETLFKGRNAVGEYVNVNGIAYKVVGVYVQNKERNDQDAFVPFTTAQNVYIKGDKIDQILFTTKGLDTREKGDAFEQSYKEVLAAHHRFDPTDRSAVWLWNRFTFFLQFLDAQQIIQIAIWVIGIFTLLSGVVGVSNIMLITVKERTKEFGIRKALGASPASILWLIILESIIITTFFGYIGMVGGIALTEWGARLFDAQAVAESTDFLQFTIFKDPTVGLGTALSFIVLLVIAGTLAGFFPARKAVQIKPIEALRAD